MAVESMKTAQAEADRLAKANVAKQLAEESMEKAEKEADQQQEEKTECNKLAKQMAEDSTKNALNKEQLIQEPKQALPFTFDAKTKDISPQSDGKVGKPFTFAQTFTSNADSLQQEEQDSPEKEPEEEALPSTEEPRSSDAVQDPLRSVVNGTPTFSASFKMDIEKELARRFPILNTKEEFREARAFIRECGPRKLKENLQEKGFVDASGMLTTGTEPFNIFARVASGAMTQDGMDIEQSSLGSYAEKYVVACNRPESDVNWQKSSNASMAKHHRFLTTKDLRWFWFNVLTIGLEDLDEAIAELCSMRDAAKAYSSAQKWTGPLGLYVHVYPHNSVNSLHIHMLDLSQTGPTFQALAHKNLPLDVVIETLQEERRASREEAQPVVSSARPTSTTRLRFPDATGDVQPVRECRAFACVRALFGRRSN
jgi:hypothetical protein